MAVTSITSRSRVQSALARRPTDRVPVYMWFHPVTAVRMGRLLEIPPSRVSEAMGDDITQIWVNNNYAMEGIVHERDGEGHTDFWGIGWEKQGPFNQINHTPLSDATPEQVLAYKFPYEHLEELLTPMAKLVASARKDIYVGCDVSPCVFEMYWRLRGMEGTFMDMAAEPALADEMFRRCADFAHRLSVESCRRFKLDWLWTGDDVAGQLGMMMSPQQWRQFIRPHLARVVKVGKDAGLPVAYHCCGSLRPIIGDLIEIGIDVLNPIQCNCVGMEPLELKKEFGSRMAFMGGVDTQDLLPHGTADEVRRATARLIEGMTSGGGGYILAASHTVPPETPDDNIFAMYEVAGISRQEIFDRAAEIRKANRR